MTIRKYAIGSNIAGYMPDSTSFEVHGNAQAIEALKSEIVLTIDSFDGFDPTNVEGYDEGWLNRMMTHAKRDLRLRGQVNIWVKDRVHWVMSV
jgi:hypothetical protein